MSNKLPGHITPGSSSSNSGSQPHHPTLPTTNQNANAHRALGGTPSIFSASPSAFASRVAMGHFSYNRPTPYTSIGTGSSVGSGTPGVSHLSAFAAQASALSGHARTSHGSRHPATGSPSQMSVASPPPNATTSSGRRHEQMPPITRYRLTPPKMLPPLHNEQANEYPDYYPHRSDQPEYQLNTQVIQQGYKATAILENESMSARNILCDHWKNTNTLTALEEFLTDVARQQTRSTRLPRESSWRPPTKYRVSDLKKEQWLLDLSNVSVPLHALAHSIPTGLKGEKLLEALATRQPPLVRAIWSIKVTSLADLDTGSTFTLSLELKNTLAQFLEAQLAELAGGPRTTSTPSMGYMTGRMVGNAFRPWQNEESRNRWTSRWWYSTRLAESLHNEGLVDQRHFLKWILDRLATSGLEQTVVLLPLVLALLDDIIRSRALSRILINALLEKLQTVFRLSETEGKSRRFQHAIDEIAVTLQLICIRWPDAIVQPKSWHRYELTLKRLSSIDSIVVAATQQTQLLQDYLVKIERRNQAFTIRVKEPELVVYKLLHALLDPKSRESAMQQWIDRTHKQLAQSVKQLCQWTIIAGNNDDCIYVATALLTKLRQASEKSVQTELQSILVEFLEQSVDEDIQRLVRLYDQLIQYNVFSYTRYLRRLVVCGTLQNSMSESFSQRQINILTALPFKNTNSAAANQRHILLYGINSTLNPEENTIHTLVTRLSDKLPYLAASNLDNNNNGNNSNNNSDAFQMNGTSALATRHDDQANSTDANLKSRRTFTPVAAMTEPLIDDATLDDELQLELDEDTVTLLKDSSRYCQVYITRQWLMPLVKQFVVKEVQIGLDNWRVITSPGSSLLNARQLATIINIMEIVQDTRTLIELVLWVIDHTEDQAMCILCIDTLLRHDTCIMALQWQTKVFDVIATKYARLGIKSCGFNMMNSLKRLISRGYGTVDQVKAKLADPEFTLLMTNTSGGLSANSSLPPLPSNTSASTSNPLHSSYATPNTVAAGAAMATTTATSNLILLPDQISDMRFQPLILDTRQVATLAQSIWFKYHTETNWFTRLLDSLNVSLDEHAESLYDPVKACQKLQVFANLIGYLMRGDIALRHLLQQWINDRVMTDQAKLTSAEHRKWRLLLLLTLIARDSFDLIYSLEKIVNPLLTSITNDTQQQTWDKALVADLLNWLSAVLLQKSSSFVQLSIEESLLLETRICTQIEQLVQCRNILSLLIPLTKLEMALPLSDALRHQCHGLRHQLLKANWFKQACLSDPMSFVNYLVQQKSETTRESFMLILQSGLIMTGAPENGHSPDETYYMEAFSYALSNLSPWNLTHHRAIIYLALTGLGYDPQNEQSSRAREEEQDSQTTSMDIDGESNTVLTNESGKATTTSEHDSSIACAFFESIVLQSTTDLQLLYEIIFDMPTSVLCLLIRHGQHLLEASMTSFPVNFVIFPGLVDNPIMFTTSLERMYTIMLMLMARADTLNEKMEKVLEQMACSLLAQLQRLVTHTKVLTMMTCKSLKYNEAIKLIEHDQTVLEEDQSNQQATFDQLRLCMELRLRLTVPLLTRLLSQPQTCATDNWIVTLLELLTNPLMTDTSYFDRVEMPCNNDHDVNKMGESSLFEFTLDLLSFLLDEIPNDIRKHVLGTMRNMEVQLDLPQVYAERIRRVLPFKVRYAYQYTTPTELAPLLDPWRWLEDTPVIMGRHPASVSTPAPFTPNTGGIVSTPGTGDDTVIVPIKPDTRNDTPLSLSLFGTRRLQRVDSTLVAAIHGGQVTAGWSCPTTINTTSSVDGSHHQHTAGDTRQSKLTSPEPGELAAAATTTDNVEVIATTSQKRPAEDELPDI